MLVVGEREAQNGTASLRRRTGEDLGAVPVERSPRRARAPRSEVVPPPSPWGGRLSAPRHARSHAIQSKDIRVNEGIRVREVRVVSADGEQLGILPIAQALDLARQREMDLVEVAAEAVPPVCRIMDFGKYKYMQARRQKDARKKQTVIQVKEVKLGPKTDTHDFDFKAKHVRRFLEEGNKAKVTVRFKGREMAHTELGWKMLNRMAEIMPDIAVDREPSADGRPHAQHDPLAEATLTDVPEIPASGGGEEDTICRR